MQVKAYLFYLLFKYRFLRPFFKKPYLKDLIKCNQFLGKPFIVISTFNKKFGKSCQINLKMTEPLRLF